MNTYEYDRNTPTVEKLTYRFRRDPDTKPRIFRCNIIIISLYSLTLSLSSIFPLFLAIRYANAPVPVS